MNETRSACAGAMCSWIAALQSFPMISSFSILSDCSIRSSMVSPALRLFPWSD